jgi:hypothetical protein
MAFVVLFALVLLTYRLDIVECVFYNVLYLEGTKGSPPTPPVGTRFPSPLLFHVTHCALRNLISMSWDISSNERMGL